MLQESKDKSYKTSQARAETHQLCCVLLRCAGDSASCKPHSDSVQSRSLRLAASPQFCVWPWPCHLEQQCLIEDVNLQMLIILLVVKEAGLSEQVQEQHGVLGLLRVICIDTPLSGASEGKLGRLLTQRLVLATGLWSLLRLVPWIGKLRKEPEGQLTTKQGVRSESPVEGGLCSCVPWATNGFCVFKEL